MYILIETCLCGQEGSDSTDVVAKADTLEEIEEGLRKAKLLCVKKIENTGDGDEVENDYEYEMSSRWHGDQYRWKIVNLDSVDWVKDLEDVNLLEGHEDEFE